MHAAAKAGELGLRCVVVDENAEAGGQYYRQPALGSVLAPDSRQQRGRIHIDHAASVATLRLGCTVYGMDGDGRFWLEQDGVAESVRPRAVLIATGAFDTPVAFPGWTLPGVMSAGAAQVLVKNQRVRPGQRAVVAGSGPMLFAVAATLRRAGVRIAEIVEATSFRQAMPFLPPTLLHPTRYAELAGYALPLVASRVPIRRGHIVAAAEGDGRLEAVRLRESGRHGTSAGRERTVEADLLCVGYGLSASTELVRLAGCRLVWDDGLGQKVPDVDLWQAASRPGFFVAGEAGGLGGAEIAAVGGELAAIGAARHLGRLQESEAAQQARSPRRRLRALKSFAAVLPRVFPRPDGLAQLPTDNTTLCRCENVTLSKVLEAMDESGAATLNEIKTTSRCGMGWCQGRVCGMVLPTVLAAHRPGFDVASSFTARSPIRPIAAASMAALEPRHE